MGTYVVGISMCMCVREREREREREKERSGRCGGEEPERDVCME